MLCQQIKLLSNGLCFHEFRPRFALFSVVGTGRINGAPGLVSASVVSRVVAVNNSRIKGPDGAIASVHSSAAEIFAKATRSRNYFHRPQCTSTNLERLEVCLKPHADGTRLYSLSERVETILASSNHFSFTFFA
ncbi:hypothetical protein AVEN_189950-1 [Araneus ventricosus]|uniref:Uncharacterized protein n=1 Tax=Araneus ventricosus TaxID=182803 RepID=A0A4Y2F0Y5_ARAVE|nr:hypothetical protein AVEN_189950-1 [Araneus ventricosus]